MHLRALIGMLLTALITDGWKTWFPEPRPKGARNCNFWADNGNREDEPGMPSGHSSISTFFSAFYYQQTANPWIKGLLVLYALLVMLSRYVKHCHSLPQIVTGASIGLLMNALTGYAFSAR
jgi:membrane-associated phospholipid phosphatase